MELSQGLLASLQKVRLFADLSPTQIKRLFATCKQESFPEGAELCRAGGHSDSMYILISGAVEIRSASGTVLAREEAVTTIGETGLLSGEIRAATVRVCVPVTALVIRKVPLLQIMQSDAGMAIRLYRNAMVLVRQKLMAADELLEASLRQADEADGEHDE